MCQFCSHVAVSVRELSSEIPASHTGQGLNALCFKATRKEFRKNYHYSNTSLYIQQATSRAKNWDHICSMTVPESGNSVFAVVTCSLISVAEMSNAAVWLGARSWKIVDCMTDCSNERYINLWTKKLDSEREGEWLGERWIIWWTLSDFVKKRNNSCGKLIIFLFLEIKLF
jgi:hypothetical protein